MRLVVLNSRLRFSSTASVAVLVRKSTVVLFAGWYARCGRMAACFVANAIPALGDRVGSGYSMHQYRYCFGFARTLSYDAAAKGVLHAAETSK